MGEQVTKKCTLTMLASVATILGLIIAVIVIPLEFLVWNRPAAAIPLATPNPTQAPVLLLLENPTTIPEGQPSHSPTVTPSQEPSHLPTTTPTTPENDWCPSGATTTSISDNYNVGTEDDSTEPIIGGLDNIDKIIRIEVFRAWYGPYISIGVIDDTITKIRVTYRLKDGREVALTRGEHVEEDPQGKLEIPEGVYLTSVNLSRNKNLRVIDYVVFCLSDSSCHGPWGGDSQHTLENLSHENGVIKSFFGDVIDWVYTLGCYYEVCSEE